MTAMLDGPVEREMDHGGAMYGTDSFRGNIARTEGETQSLELSWRALVSGDAAITAALDASLTAKQAAKGFSRTWVNQ